MRSLRESEKRKRPGGETLVNVQKGSSHGRGGRRRRRKWWIMSMVSRTSQGHYSGPRDFGNKEVTGTLGEVIFTDTLETKAPFQMTEESPERM